MQSKTPQEALAEVKGQLQIAIELEHSTIPPYLYAFWTIKDHESEVARDIFDLIKEEMLHMALGCNILNSIGGYPKLNSKKFIPKYPTSLPGHDQLHDPFIVDLRKLDIKSIVTFLHIELPQDLGLQDDDDDEVSTIGEFYDRIWANLKLLTDDMYQKRRQLGPEFAPYLSGNLFEVCCREDAYNAIEEIIEQGEGTSIVVDPKPGEELPHFQRFFEIYKKMGGRGEIIEGHFDTLNMVRSVDKQVKRQFRKHIRNVVSNPRLRNSKSKAAKYYNRKFNSLYSRMLDRMHDGFNMDKPNILPAIELMFLMTRPALELMSIPVNKRKLSKGYCGPTFDYLDEKKRV
jgi:hypothetical protein